MIFETQACFVVTLFVLFVCVVHGCLIQKKIIEKH